MGRVGIFGGTFNPPHFGHLICASAAFEELDLNKVVFVPVGEPAHKEIADDPGREARYEMTRIATQDDPRFEVSRIEVDRPGPSYTLATLKALKLEAPEGELSFIVGGDMAAGLPQWHRPEEVVQLAEFVVASRSGVQRSEIEEAFESLDARNRVKFFEMPQIDISSSEIRSRLAKGSSVRNFVPDDVLKYIETNNLYSQGQA